MEFLHDRITNVVSKLDSSHKLYMLTKMSEGGNATVYSTDLLFGGYDNTNNRFFGYWCPLDKTNQVTLDTFFERSQTTKGGAINAVGAAEPTKQFILGNKNKLVSLLPKDSVQPWSVPRVAGTINFGRELVQILI
jgi:hypothetical protein